MNKKINMLALVILIAYCTFAAEDSMKIKMKSTSGSGLAMVTIPTFESRAQV